MALSILSINLAAQTNPSSINQRNDILLPLENNERSPCISQAEYENIELRCKENIQKYNIDQSLNKLSPGSVLLNWPLKASPKLKDCSYYYMSAFVDQNINPTAFQDYSCGTRTYDGHTGTDISTWPFNFYKLDNDLVEVVAAAGGTILDKHDGEFDKNCGTNTLSANYLIIQHADGSQANYWHMKKNSLTKKTIGQKIEAGEFIGIVGSSGNASGPHLHFEVWAGNTKATRVDPYAGTCNTLNASSWWNAQHTYKETSVTKVSTNSTDIVLPPCPETETLNEQDTFKIPFQGPGLSPGYAKFYVFFKDEIAGLTADMNILNPDGSVFANWTTSSTMDGKVRAAGFSKKLPVVAGNYIFKANYNGLTCSKSFTIVTTTNTNEINSTFHSKIYPNPSNGNFTLECKQLDGGHFQLFDLLGNIICSNEIQGSINPIQLQIPTGIYIYKLSEKNQIKDRGKLIIE